MGKDLTLTSDDGHSFVAYRADPSGTPKGAIMVIQEIFGVNKHIREVCDGFAADGFVAVAPSLYDRSSAKAVQLGYTPWLPSGPIVRIRRTSPRAATCAPSSRRARRSRT